MTKEEAAEIVLAGPKHPKCTKCKGKGWVHGEIKEGTPLTLVESGYVEARHKCTICFGLGYFPDQEYLLAQKIVGIEAVQVDVYASASVPYGKAVGTPEPTTTPGKMCVWVKPDFTFSMERFSEKRLFMVQDEDD